MTPLNILVHEGTTYVDVIEYTKTIVDDLQKTPPTMVAGRDEIILALQQYCNAVLNAKG